MEQGIGRVSLLSRIKRKMRNGYWFAWMIVVVGVIHMEMEVASAAAVYTVGDTTGWSLGADYSTWTSDKTFSIGDTLVFNYPPGHTVDEISASDYKTCTTGNAIASDSSGATSILLKTSGPHYYICGVPGHCAGGMKLAITVATNATVSPAPPTGVSTALPPPSMAVPAGGTFTDPYSSSARLLTPPMVAVCAIFAIFKQYFLV